MLSITGHKLIQCLHEGTAANIYRAIRLSDNGNVIIKVSNHKLLNEKKIQCFRREFELCRLINSPYVVRYLDIQEAPSYGVAILMEDDNAIELNTVIPLQGFSIQDFLEIAIQIVEGLQAIHAANVIHNNLKTSNILFQPETKHIRIIDFGKASSFREIIPLSITMLHAETLAYTSPEQTGRVNRGVDYRTDFYSLGVVFYYLLCGHLPFTATDVLGLIHQHLTIQPPSPYLANPTIELPLSQIIMKLLEKQAENRYQSCEGILYDLNYCLSAWKKNKSIPQFNLGQQDFSSKLTLSQQLYGREREVKILSNAFQRVSQGNRETLMVTGQSGTGKSILIHEIQHSINLKKGFFIAGKFDQLNRNIAYNAIAQAFYNFIKRLLMEDEKIIAQWKTRIFSALNGRGQLITKIVPSLALIIGEQPAIAFADIKQAKNMLHLAFHDFIKVLAQADHPLVLFLDDLQWADNDSLDLMAYLMQQSGISYLLWIGAYRDTEVSAEHHLQQTLQALTNDAPEQTRVKDSDKQEVVAPPFNKQSRFATFRLEPLSFDSLKQWIADSLHMPIEAILPLAKVTQEKTGGNPFFVRLFLQSLSDQQLLTFSPETHWQWSLDKIFKLPATENVIAFIAYQIQQLPPGTQKMLSLASCLGHRLALSILEIAVACQPDELLTKLQPAFDSGALIQTGNEVFFLHDRVQETAYNLLGEEKIATHLKIGRRLEAQLSANEDLLFAVIGQFNYCRQSINNTQEHLQMIRLNLKACQKAKQTTAYSMGLDYLYAGKRWLDSKKLWQLDYELAYSFHKEMAEMEYVCGHLDTSQSLIAEMQPYLQNTQDKIDIYHLLIIQKIMQGQQKEAISIGHCALTLLGNGLPLNNSSEFIEKEMPVLRENLAKRQLPSLLDSLLVEAAEQQAIFKILAAIYSACYQTGSELLPAIIIIAIKLSLKFGHAPESCPIYAAYGALLCGKFREYKEGYKYADFAVQLAKKLKSPAQICRSSLIMHNLVSAWSVSIQQLPEALAAAFKEGLACGEIEYAGYCSALRLHMLFDRGTSLPTVQQELSAILQFAESTKTKGVLYDIMRSLQRVVANLMGETPHEDDFSYDNLSESAFEHECQKLASSGMSLGFYYLRKAQVLYLYGRFELALQQLERAKSKLTSLTGFYETALFNWYDSLTRLALYATITFDKQQDYLQQIRTNQQQMKIWQASCPANFDHKYWLVEAELARIQNDYTNAEIYYNSATESAKRYGFVQEQALAAELGFQYWSAKGHSLCAKGYFSAAQDGYRQWGASRKLMLLNVRYFDQFASPTVNRLQVGLESNVSMNKLGLDQSSILKASQAISREIALPNLLRVMMQIIIENAGAQQGAMLLVEAEDQIFVQAEYTADRKITVLQKIPLASWANGARMLIQAAKRMQQPLVVDNASIHEQFRADPYVNQTKAKSIVCIPMLKGTELKAILYAENNLLSHAFTFERVLTLQVLITQMMISLENARYFAEQIALTRQLAEQAARTERAEESLQMLTHDLHLALEASQAGTWNWDMRTNKVTWDKANCALFGLSVDEFEGAYADVLERVHPDDRELLNQEVKRCMELDKPHDMVYRIICPDGSQRVIAARGRVYRDKKSQPIKMAGVCLDITQRKRLEQERLEAIQRADEERIRREEALAYQQRQKEYTETVCHELRNPLHGLIGSVELLKTNIKASWSLITPHQPMPQQKSKEHLQHVINEIEDDIVNIEECSNHLKGLLDDVLDLAKLQADKMELASEIIKPKEIIQTVAKMFAAQTMKKKLKLDLQLPETEIIVKGDARRLRQILINLVSNAVKFTKEGSITVQLTILQISEQQTLLQFAVIDTGIGMTPEEKSRLFQRFSQANVNVSSQYGGTGLGLELCNKLVKLMHGNIEVISKKGQGTQFIFAVAFDLPAKEELKKITLTEKPEIIFKQSPILKPASIKILLAEDNLFNQKILKKMLEMEGYAVQTANDGVEAVSKFEKNIFDLIFMDTQMPHMDGITATRIIRAKERECNWFPTPIINLSGAIEVDREKALQAGMNDVLSKPAKPDQITAIIKKHTDTQKISVKFTYDQPEAETVHLAGSFNRWLNAAGGKVSDEYAAWKMHKEKDGIWQLVILLAPGTYAFKYAVNSGQRWENAPNYPVSLDQHKNSILTVEPLASATINSYNQHGMFGATKSITEKASNLSVPMP